MHADELSGLSTQKLQSLSLTNLNTYPYLHQKLLGVLHKRHGCDIALENLVVRSCRVHSGKYEGELRTSGEGHLG